MNVLVGIVIKYFADAPAVKRIIDEEGCLDADSASLDAMLYSKKTGTLLKRAASLRIYSSWFETTVFMPVQFLSEAAVYKYVLALNADNAPATRAAAFKEAANFIAGILSLDVEEMRTSSRVHGLTCKLLRTRAGVRQRMPLSVDMVRALEELLADEADEGTVDAVHCGVVLFGLFARARVGDLRRCDVEPSLDLSPDGHGFVETRFYDHKAARPGSRRALPICAPAQGVTGRSWGKLFVAARSKHNMDAKRGGLLPALGTDGHFTEVPYLTQEFAVVLRHLLLKVGCAPADLENVGAHSLKATCLAWAARFGLPRDVRRTLGYHADPADKSMDSYARDVAAPALRELEKVLKAIREKSFDPDCTRSGAFVVKTDVASQPVEPDEATTDTACSSSEPADSEDVPTGQPVDFTVLLNTATNFAHIVHQSDPELTFCGKPVPLKVLKLQTVPAGARLCRRCF